VGHDSKRRRPGQLLAAGAASRSVQECYAQHGVARIAQHAVHYDEAAAGTGQHAAHYDAAAAGTGQHAVPGELIYDPTCAPRAYAMPQMRGTVGPANPWDVMVDMFFYREPEEAKEEAAEEVPAVDYAPDTGFQAALPGAARGQGDSTGFQAARAAARVRAALAGHLGILARWPCKGLPCWAMLWAGHGRG
jgi:hypothetical protein